MTVLQIIFYVFAAVAIFSGLMVIIARNTVHSVLFLVLTFFASAGLWLLMDAEFLALILVLVYVGAVMTLFLFVVMMLRLHVAPLREGFVRFLPIAAMIVAVIVGLAMLVLGPSHFGLSVVATPAALPADYNNIANLGSVLYTDYAYPFEVAGVLLLTAIVAAIALAHRKAHGRKSQNSAEQIAVRAADRMRLVKMKVEKKK